MLRTRPHAAALGCALAAAATLAAAAGAAALTPELERLLAASDPFAAVPAELRLELVLVGASGARVPLEIWRKGEEFALVRFLQPAERGKYVIRRGAEAWLLAPAARAPVKLSPALAPAAGAALEELLALRLARDFRPVAASEARGVVTFDLEAVRAGSAPPRLRWVVDRARRRPLRAEFRAADGQVLRLVEFASWHEQRPLLPAVLVTKDLRRGGRPLVVEIRTLEPRPVPLGLFDLADGSARAALPPPAASVPRR